jgi:hypothetical protein
MIDAINNLRKYGTLKTRYSGKVVKMYRVMYN